MLLIVLLQWPPIAVYYNQTSFFFFWCKSLTLIRSIAKSILIHKSTWMFVLKKPAGGHKVEYKKIHLDNWRAVCITTILSVAVITILFSYHQSNLELNCHQTFNVASLNVWLVPLLAIHNKVHSTELSKFLLNNIWFSWSFCLLAYHWWNVDLLDTYGIWNVVTTILHSTPSIIFRNIVSM